MIRLPAFVLPTLLTFAVLEIRPSGPTGPADPILDVMGDAGQRLCAADTWIQVAAILAAHAQELRGLTTRRG